MPEISLFAYFMAHAPAEPQPWFEPSMCAPPKEDPRWQFCEGCKADSDCEHNAQCDEIQAFRVQFKAWQKRRDAELLLQWPAAWAREQVRRVEQ